MFYLLKHPYIILYKITFTPSLAFLQGYFNLFFCLFSLPPLYIYYIFCFFFIFFFFLFLNCLLFTHHLLFHFSFHLILLFFDKCWLSPEGAIFSLIFLLHLKFYCISSPIYSFFLYLLNHSNYQSQFEQECEVSCFYPPFKTSITSKSASLDNIEIFRDCFFIFCFI